MRLLNNRMFLCGLSVIAILAVCAVFASFIAPYDPNEISIQDALRAPSAGHLFGTDQLGRDIFSRILFGARISLSIGFVAVGISIVIGVFFGAIAGYYGGKVDNIIMRFVDIMFCFPTFFLMLAIIAIVGPGIFNIMVVIGLTSWMGMARLIRAEVLSLKEREFVQAARAVGASDLRIIFTHILPNAANPILVNATLGVGAAILVESGLSFLGLGVQPPTASWGNILIEAKATLGTAWWITLFPGVFILITVIAYNLMGEGLRDMLSER